MKTGRSLNVTRVSLGIFTHARNRKGEEMRRGGCGDHENTRLRTKPGTTAFQAVRSGFQPDCHCPALSPLLRHQAGSLATRAGSHALPFHLTSFGLVLTLKEQRPRKARPHPPHPPPRLSFKPSPGKSDPSLQRAQGQDRPGAASVILVQPRGAILRRTR